MNNSVLQIKAGMHTNCSKKQKFSEGRKQLLKIEWIIIL